jgi:hypothetical protein
MNNSNGDTFASDYFSIGSAEQAVATVPESPTWAMILGFSSVSLPPLRYGSAP